MSVLILMGIDQRATGAEMLRDIETVFGPDHVEEASVVLAIDDAGDVRFVKPITGLELRVYEGGPAAAGGAYRFARAGDVVGRSEVH